MSSQILGAVECFLTSVCGSSSFAVKNRLCEQAAEMRQAAA